MGELDDLVTFVRVAETGSLSRAAERLGISKSIVSRRLDRLERELGAKLLQRSTRGVVLTDAGRAFGARCSRILADLAEAREEVAGSDGQLIGRLRLSAPVTFGARHLAPALAAFASQHEQLLLDVVYGDRTVDLIREGYDAAVRIGALADSSLIARKLAPVRHALIASPAYLARRGTPASPDDLRDHVALVANHISVSDAWRFRVGSRWVSAPAGETRMLADNADALLAGAVAGLGLALLPTFVAADAIGRGELVPLLTDHALPERSLFLLRPPGLASAKVRALTDFLAARFGPEPYWDPCWQAENRRTGGHAVHRASLGNGQDQAAAR